MAKEGRDTNRVAAILIRDNKDRILLGKRRDSGKFANPGGHLKVGENAIEGAARELKEETGLDAKELKLLGMHKVGKLLIYLFEAQIDPNQKIDTSKDPDKECPSFEFHDPIDIKAQLHVPIKNNLVVQYWANH